MKCGERKADGEPCKAWAVRGTDPPVCAAHGGARARIGAPEGNRNARKHGAYAGEVPADDLGKRITDLATRIERVGRYIDEGEDLELDEFMRLHALHASMTSRLGRLKKQLRDMGGGDDRLAQAVDRALDKLSEEWGVEL